MKDRIIKNRELDALVNITTKHEDIDDLTRKIIRAAIVLRFT